MRDSMNLVFRRQIPAFVPFPHASVDVMHPALREVAAALNAGLEAERKEVAELEAQIDRTLQSLAKGERLKQDNPEVKETITSKTPSKADRPDEEDRLRSYIADHLRYGRAETTRVSEPAKARMWGDSLLECLEEATAEAESNNGWGKFREAPLSLAELTRRADLVRDHQAANPGWGIDNQGPYNETSDQLAAMEDHVDTTLAADQVSWLAPFHIGDEVRLVSGGRTMTVEDVDYCEHCESWHIDVVWHDKHGIFREVSGLDSRLLVMA
jgi:uncharacterized protein YodC (DUF2158 family)